MQLYKFQIQVGQQLWEQFRDPNLLGLYFIDGEYALDYIYHFWLEGFAVFGIESYVPAGCDFLNDGLRYFAELSAFLLDSPEESFAVITLLYNELNNLGYILIIARLQIIQRLQRNLKDHLQILFPQTLVDLCGLVVTQGYWRGIPLLMMWLMISGGEVRWVSVNLCISSGDWVERGLPWRQRRTSWWGREWRSSFV